MDSLTKIGLSAIFTYVAIKATYHIVNYLDSGLSEVIFIAVLAGRIAFIFEDGLISILRNRNNDNTKADEE